MLARMDQAHEATGASETSSRAPSSATGSTDLKSIEGVGARGRDSEAGFPPPDEPIMVYCLHCGKEYMSSEMIPPDGGARGRAARTPIMMEGMWWCATPGCNAGGFGLDIFPVNPDWKDPKGLLQIIKDDGDDEFEWDDDDDDDDDNGGAEGTPIARDPPPDPRPAA